MQQLQTTTALIDSGASSNVIYMAEVDKLGVAIERDTDKRIEGVTGDAEVLGTINLKFNIEGLEGTYEAEYWVIAGVRDPPLIIGLPFMGKHEMELRRGVGGRYALWRPGEEALREARREASEKLVKARRLRDCIAMLNEEGIAVGTKVEASGGTGWHNQPGGMAKNRVWRKETSGSETKEESEQQSEKESEEEPGKVARVDVAKEEETDDLGAYLDFMDVDTEEGKTSSRDGVEVRKVNVVGRAGPYDNREESLMRLVEEIVLPPRSVVFAAVVEMEDSQEARVERRQWYMPLRQREGQEWYIVPEQSWTEVLNRVALVNPTLELITVQAGTDVARLVKIAAAKPLKELDELWKRRRGMPILDPSFYEITARRLKGDGQRQTWLKASRVATVTIRDESAGKEEVVYEPVEGEDDVEGVVEEGMQPPPEETSEEETKQAIRDRLEELKEAGEANEEFVGLFVLLMLWPAKHIAGQRP